MTAIFIMLSWFHKFKNCSFNFNVLLMKLYLNSVWLSFCFFSSFKLETKGSLLKSFFIQSLQKSHRKDVRIRGKCRRKESVGKTLGKNRDRERKPM